MGALLTAVQVGVALGTRSCEFDIRRQRCRAIEAARSRYVLHQARQSRASHVNGGTRAIRFWPVLAWSSAIAVRIHVTGLSVLAITVHGEKWLRHWWASTLFASPTKNPGDKWTSRQTGKRD